MLPISMLSGRIYLKVRVDQASDKDKDEVLIWVGETGIRLTIKTPVLRVSKLRSWDRHYQLHETQLYVSIVDGVYYGFIHEHEKEYFEWLLGFGLTVEQATKVILRVPTRDELMSDYIIRNHNIPDLIAEMLGDDS